jgi:hypothetical protein
LHDPDSYFIGLIRPENLPVRVDPHIRPDTGHARGAPMPVLRALLHRRFLSGTIAAAVVAIGTSFFIGAGGSAPLKGQEARPDPVTVPEGEQLPGYNVERNAYFGDLHVHTSFSFDAYIVGTRSTPDDAYRFAKGETIQPTGGPKVRLLGGPLDFTAVTEHAEYLGGLNQTNDPHSILNDVPAVQELIAKDPAAARAAFLKMVDLIRTDTMPKEMNDPSVVGRAWEEVQKAAARHNDPGHFTTFVGYEYSSMPNMQNLHRNVIFRTANVPKLPFSKLDSENPEDLWKAMDAWRAQGIESLAIPHNSNGSDGLMFQQTQFNGSPMDKAYADRRIRNEPLVEISQMKGTSETHPTLSPNDEWANFEIYGAYIGSGKRVTKFQGGYVRQALRDGILMRQKSGFNPYKLGFVGGTDTHNGMPGSGEERNYVGGLLNNEATAEQRGSIPPKGAKTWPADTIKTGDTTYAQTLSAKGASGLTGVWAEENSREAIYAALRRKETFATSGPRIRVRFFASYDFPDDLPRRNDLVRIAYARGTTMGGDLAPSNGAAPKFLVWAMRDPTSGFLQRAQIVKGWVEKGVSHEQVFDVACSDNLPLDKKTWRCPDNGAGVNPATCEPDQYKGDVELRTLWTDPTFRPGQRAFYYVRVLENPTCRWSTWDAIRNGTPPRPGTPTTIMERAWSSPIWYEPKS